VNQKGSTKRVNPPNFWSKCGSQVSDELKTMVEEQYVSIDSLHIYCDCSLNVEMRQMACASTYVSNGRIIVKQQYIYPPPDCYGKPIFGELKSIIFALTHFEKYLMPGCKSIVFYSDVVEIDRILNNQIAFRRKASLQKLKSELILLYQKMRKKHPTLTIEIKYLRQEEKINNPFHRASHNAANKMLNKKV
jgi:hypothetical protein